MALFDLRCQNCQHEFQEMVSFSKLPDIPCPECGSTEKTRIYKATIKGPISSGSGSGFNSGSSPPSSGFT